MTKEFEELTNRLAKAYNTEGGTYLLITDVPDEDEIRLTVGGKDITIVYTVCDVLKSVLADTTDEKAAAFREHIKGVIIADEQRRQKCNN